MNCRVCDAAALELSVDLGSQPWANHFLRPEERGSEPRYPLRLVFCRRCRTAQLDHTVAKETMFSDHTYLSGTTASLAAHFQRVAQEVDARQAAGSTRRVLDIGSNDGTQLRHYRDLGWEVLGVESAATPARVAGERGITTVRAFFDQRLASTLPGPFDVINAAGVFFHLEELHSAAEGIRSLLRPGGVFVVQFLYLRCILETLAFDQIYHEHLLYYSLRTLQALLERHGLFIHDAALVPIHGGSVVAFAGPERTAPSARLQALLAEEEAAGVNELETHRRFGARIAVARTRTLELLDRWKDAGRRVYGLGAPVKGNTRLNTFGIGTQYLDCLVERNPLRRGLFSPGMHIPVLLEDELPGPPDVYFVLAWNFREEILARHQDLVARGVEFHFPVEPGGEA